MKFYSGCQGKPNFDQLCNGCEERPRKESIGCLESGCHRFRIVIDELHGGKLLYHMNCTNCKQWTPVKPGDGWWCRSCGMGCAYPAYIEATKQKGAAIRIVGGPLLDEDEEDDDNVVEINFEDR